MSRPIARPRAGFTLIELLVVIAIIAILAGILFPVFSRARAKGRQASCLSNQKQLATGIIMYADDWEKYPDTNWYHVVEGINGVTTCPDTPDVKVGYGMNGYLHNLRRDLIRNPSELIVTADATATSTIETEFGRHFKGAIVSHLDGSATFALTPEQAGRYACGKFPIQPIVVVDGTAMLERPTIFEDLGAGDEITTQLIIVGPYGKNGTSSKKTLHIDLCGEGDLARRLADISPRVGDPAPMAEKIYDPDPLIDTGLGGEAPLQFKVWTKPTFDQGFWSTGSAGDGTLRNAYNCQYFGRTTYAALYVYSEAEQSVTMSWKCDDTGKFWLNGETRPGATGWQEDSNVDILTENTTFTYLLPKGINYFLFKVCNNTEGGEDPTPAGGMKLKLSFDKLVSVSGIIE